MIIGKDRRRAIMLSAVTRVERTADFKNAVVHTSDRECESFDASEFDSVIRNTVQASFPADGAVLLETVYDEKMKPCDVWQRAILGFYLDAAGDLQAATIDGNVSDFTVMFADGHVERFEERWDTLEEYVKQLVEKGQAA